MSACLVMPSGVLGTVGGGLHGPLRYCEIKTETWTNRHVAL
jgi:hypothetical protein